VRSEETLLPTAAFANPALSIIATAATAIPKVVFMRALLFLGVASTPVRFSSREALRHGLTDM
jgi:hypothetical protein